MGTELDISTEPPGNTPQDAPDGQPSVLAQYHNAAYNALYSDLWEYVAEGKIDIKHNYYLSKAPLQIDMMVIKKKPGVVIERDWGEMIRDHGLFEYKSPVDTAPDIWVFYKVIGYAYIYAEQNRVNIANLSATIICHKKPVALFRELEDKKCYEVLNKGNGIYYILNKGVPVEEALGFQVIVVPEEPNEDLAALLKALDERSGITFEEKEKLLRNDKSGKLKESFWVDVVFKPYIKHLEKGMDDMGLTGILELMEEKGLLADRYQKVETQGMEKVLAVLGKLDPSKVDLVKKELQLQPA